MSESQKPWVNAGYRDVFEWYESEDNSSEVLMPLGGGNSLAIMDALSDIYECLCEDDTDQAGTHMLNLGELIMGVALGISESIMNDLIVSHQMQHFDESLNKLLEEHDPHD